MSPHVFNELRRRVDVLYDYTRAVVQNDQVVQQIDHRVQLVGEDDQLMPIEQRINITCLADVYRMLTLAGHTLGDGSDAEMAAMLFAVRITGQKTGIITNVTEQMFWEHVVPDLREIFSLPIQLSDQLDTEPEYQYILEYILSLSLPGQISIYRRHADEVFASANGGRGNIYNMDHATIGTMNNFSDHATQNNIQQTPVKEEPLRSTVKSDDTTRESLSLGQLPPELSTPEAIDILNRLRNAGLLDAHYMPIAALSITDKAVLAGQISQRLWYGENHWKPFQQLWQMDNLSTLYSQGMNKASTSFIINMINKSI